MSDVGVVRLGVINTHDPSTGWATAPVAAVAWADDDVVAWSWLPGSEPARQLRADLAALDPPARIRWLVERCEDPGIVHAVDVVDELADADPGAVTVAVEELLDTVMVSNL